MNHSFLLVFVYFIECYTGNNQLQFPQVIPQNARLNVLSHFNKIKFHRKENIFLAKLNHSDHMLPSDEPNQSWAKEIYCMKSCHSECIQNLPPFLGSRQGCLLHTLWVPPQWTDGYGGYTSFRINKGDYLSLEPRSWTHSILYPEDRHMQAARAQYQMEWKLQSFTEKVQNSLKSSQSSPRSWRLEKVRGKSQGTFLGWTLVIKSTARRLLPVQISPILKEIRSKHYLFKRTHRYLALLIAISDFPLHPRASQRSGSMLAARAPLPHPPWKHKGGTSPSGAAPIGDSRVNGAAAPVCSCQRFMHSEKFKLHSCVIWNMTQWSLSLTAGNHIYYNK